MAKEAVNRDGRRGIPWRILGWGTAALVLVLPLVSNAPWTASDFAFAAALLGGVGLAFEFIVRRSGTPAYRFGALLTVAAAALTVLINGSVGMIGSEDNPYNLLFLGVPVIALVGAVFARFEAPGMMRATAVAGIAQLAAGVAGLPTDTRGAVLSMLFAGIWALAAAAFRKAASDEPGLRSN
jgi:hypothetical protein